MMKRTIPLLLLGIGCTLLVATLVRRTACDSHLKESVAQGDSICWFHCGLGLNAETCNAIERIQREFEPTCAGLCASVSEAKQALAQVPVSAPDEARAEAAEKLKHAEEIRRAALIAQVRRIAGLMPRETGRRYLEIVLPRMSERVGSLSASNESLPS